MEKLKDKHAILNNLHIVMYIPIEPNENIETFMIHRKNKVIENHYEKIMFVATCLSNYDIVISNIFLLQSSSIGHFLIASNKLQ
jgi:hypothetical protein